MHPKRRVSRRKSSCYYRSQQAMSKKRRTRKAKKNAKHHFVYSWNPSSTEPSKRSTVKGQFDLGSKPEKSGSRGSKKAKHTASKQYLYQTKKEIIKSVSLASLIVSLELVIYFLW